MASEKINIGYVAASAGVHILARPVSKIGVKDVVVFPSRNIRKACLIVPVTKTLGCLDSVRKIWIKTTAAVDVYCSCRIGLRPGAVCASDSGQRDNCSSYSVHLA